MPVKRAPLGAVRHCPSVQPAQPPALGKSNYAVWSDSSNGAGGPSPAADRAQGRVDPVRECQCDTRLRWAVLRAHVFRRGADLERTTDVTPEEGEILSTVLITGSAGLIGSEAVGRFAADGHQVVGIDNDMR